LFWNGMIVHGEGVFQMACIGTGVLRNIGE
jgi:hypothetical protein